jgi:hypothetical protein
VFSVVKNPKTQVFLGELGGSKIFHPTPVFLEV